MMKANEHANLLSIFFWVYSVLQAMMVLLMAIYTGFFGLMMIAIGTGDAPDAMEGMALMGIFTLVFLVIVLIGTASMIVNIVTGFGLRNRRRWARSWGIAASIGSIVSIICGGLLLLPFGTAIGIYGLWFFCSDAGQDFPSENVAYDRFQPHMIRNNWSY